jgi:hypothetical protein
MTISSSPKPLRTEPPKGEAGWGAYLGSLCEGENIEFGASVVLASRSK